MDNKENLLYSLYGKWEWEQFVHSNQCREEAGLERLIKAKPTAPLRINGYTNVIYNSDPFLVEMSLYQSVDAAPTLSQIFC